MAEGGKKAGVVAGGLFVAMGFVVRNVDDCARVGARGAMHADNVAIAGARSSGDDLARLGARGGDRLADFGAYAGDDVARLRARGGDGLVPGSLGPRGSGAADDVAEIGRQGPRAGGSWDFSRARFIEPRAPRSADLAELRARGALELTEEELDDLTELIADVGVDIAEESAEWIVDELSDDEEDEEDEDLDGGAVQVLAVADGSVTGADRTASTLEGLLLALDESEGLPVVVASEEGADSLRIRVRGGHAPRLARPLAHAARLGRSCVVVLCQGEDLPGERSCAEEAVRVVRAAAQGGRAGLLERLVTTRDRSAIRTRVGLFRLRDSGAGLRVLESPAAPR